MTTEQEREFGDLHSAHLESLKREVALEARCKRLEAAAQLALDWATGQGQFANGKDTIPELADVVAPALEMALVKS